MAKKKTKKASNKNLKKKAVKIISYAAAILLLIALYVGYKYLGHAFDIKETTYVYVDERKDYKDLLEQLRKAHIKDINAFKILADAAHYQRRMKEGRYKITPFTNLRTFVLDLVRGRQSPCEVTFNNVRLKNDLIEKIGSQMMFGPDSLRDRLDDPKICKSFGFDTTTVVCMFIPDTYEVYWNLPVDRFLKKLKKYYSNFWSGSHLEKAESIPLTPVQVSTLASIVESESANKSEFSKIAGLYINRLKKGMLLQSDPTVKFAVGDFSLKRILNKHLAIHSPYNTYKVRGLPPGPIKIPSKAGIESVLDYQKSDYLYMCAKPDFSGTHNFARTQAEHLVNARKYQQALNERNIK